MAYYWAFLRNTKLHTFNRYYIVVSMLSIAVLPFCKLNIGLSIGGDRPVLNSYLKTIQEEVVPMIYQGLVIESYIIIAVLAVSFTMLFKFIGQILTVFQLKNRFKVIRVKGFDFIQTDLANAPFTFFNNLFWRTDISMQDDSGVAVFNHEIAHIKGRHSLDHVLSYFLVCLFWMNPFLWVLRKELLMVHEFLADSNSVQEGDTDSFARLILSSIKMTPTVYPVHCFFGSTMRRRLAMIGNTKKSSHSSFRKLSVIPLVLMVVFLHIAVSGCMKKELSTPITPSHSAIESTDGTFFDSTLIDVSFFTSKGVKKTVKQKVVFQVSGTNHKQKKINNLNLPDIEIKFLKSDGTTEIIKGSNIRKSS